MPRAKADTVTIHRIELGGKERQALEAWQAKQVGTGMAYGAAGLGIAAALGLVAWAVYWSLDSLYDWNEKVKEWASVYSTSQEQAESISDDVYEWYEPQGWGYRVYSWLPG